MKTSMLRTTTFVCSLIAFFLLGATTTFAGPLDGTWINKDKNTRGLTKVVISANSTKFHTYGKCHPKDCDWGKTALQKVGSGYKAVYDQGFAKRKLNIAKVGQELCVIMHTKYTDNRKARKDTYYFKKKKRKVCGRQGMVANKANYNQKIKGAVIVFVSENGKIRKTVRSGANGRYKIQLPKGRYKVSARATGYQPYSTGQGFFVVTCKGGLQTGNIFMKKRPVVKEDCIKFNHATVKVANIRGRYKIVDGSHWVFDFGTNKTEAYKALRIIKHYKMNSTCYVGRPDPSLTFLRVNGKAPKGQYAGEDCVSFNPRNISIKPAGGKFLLVDGNHSMFSFPNKKEALQAKRLIQKYGFTKSCFVGRPGPSFTYMRK